jgi:integrase
MKRHLTEITIQRLRPPKQGYLEVFDLGYPGLAVRVGHGGAVTFQHFHRAAGKLRRETLGRWPSVSLAEARDQWRKTREAISKGEVPTRNDRGSLFEVVVEEWLRRDQSDNKESSQYQLHRIVERDLLPAWRGKSVTALTKKDDIIPLLNAISDRSPSMAQKTDRYVRRFFKWCRGQDVIMTNPMEGLDALAAPEARERTLKDDELLKVWRAASDGPHSAAIRLLILTGARKEEIFALRWSEVNGDKIELTGARTKNGKAHIIPLSKPARELLRKMPRDGESVFGQISMSDRRKKAFDKLCGVTDWRIHDLRRTVATGMQKLGVTLQAVEAVLGHTSGSRGGIVGIYQRHDFASEKRAALEAWGQHVMSKVQA